MADSRRIDQVVWATRPQMDLAAVLERLAPWPPFTMLLGICEDGLPLLLDLKNPSAGSLLLVGDLERSNKNLLHVMLASTVALNEPGQVEIHLITARPQEYNGFLEVPGALEVVNVYDPQVSELLWYFTCRAHQRQCGRQNAGVGVLVIEDIETLTSQLSEQQIGGLTWVVEAGPGANSWVIAGLDAGCEVAVDERLFHAFGTRLVGAMSTPRQIEYLSGMPAALNASLTPGAQYIARVTGELIRFWLPLIADQVRPERRMVKGEV